MRYIFRGHIIFEYFPDRTIGDKVVQHHIYDQIPGFDFCRFIDEDYKLLGEFFSIIYKHTQGESVELKDIIVG